MIYFPINKLGLNILYYVNAARYIYLIVFFFGQISLSYDCDNLILKYNI